MSSDLEREWSAQEPPADFAERVLERTARAPRRWRWIAASAVGVAAAAAVVLVLAGPREVSHGEVRALERREVKLGMRGVAVLEAGASIKWRGDRVEQAAGDVFYRVEAGEQFLVHTPGGEAVVLGTCFRISVNDKEQIMKRRDLGAAAIGAAAAAVVVVGVYEGTVRVSHAGQTMTVRAGETVVSDPTGVHARAVTVASEDRAAARTTDEMKHRLEQIEQEKASLEQELTAALDGTPKKSEFDLSAADWEKLASQGSIKYELPCFRQGGFRPNAEQLQRLGLDAAGADAIQAAYRRSNQRFASTMNPICARLTGDEASDLSKCMTKLFTSIYENGQDSAHAIYTRVAEIRAGKRPEPAPAESTPAEQMLLYMTGEMATFEADLAKTFGADEAHRIAYSPEACVQASSF